MNGFSLLFFLFYLGIWEISREIMKNKKAWMSLREKMSIQTYYIKAEAAFHLLK